MQPQLIETRDGRVVTLTLNRPTSLNALSDELYDLLIEAFTRLNQDAEVAVIVVKGAGRAFCAGGDVKQMEGTQSTRSFEQRVTEVKRRSGLVQLIHDSPKATIAAVNGVAAGAGLSIALACDFRMAAHSASFTTSFIKIGLPGDMGGTYLLSRAVGIAKATELCMRSQILSALEAERLGFITQISPDKELEGAVDALAAELAARPFLAFDYMKRNLRAAEAGQLAAAREVEAFNTVRMVLTEDHMEAIRAFAEKRPPLFKGR